MASPFLKFLSLFQIILGQVQENIGKSRILEDKKLRRFAGKGTDMTDLQDEEKTEQPEQVEQDRKCQNLEDTQPFWEIEPRLGVPTDLREEEARWNEPREIYEQMTQPVLLQGKTRALAVGAMCACLVVVLALMGYYMPFLSFAISFFVPLPMVIAGLQCGAATGAVSLAAAGVLLSMFVGPLSAITVVARYGLLGLALGVCFRRKISGGKTFAVVTVVATVGIALGTLFSFWVAGVPILQGLRNMVTAVTSVFDVLAGQEQMLALLPPGMSMAEYIAFLKQTAAAILPAIFVIYCMLTVWVTYAISSFLLGRMGYAVVRLPLFSRWQMPLPILWLAMLGLAFGIAGNYLGMETFSNISFNLLYMTIPLFLLCGMSVLYYYLQRRDIPQVMKTMTLLFLIIFAAFGFILLTMVGMFDTLFDWRRLHSSGFQKQ